ncbi:MAG: hypothetical protein WA990_07970 [Rubrobacteraceae bacterium]
MNEDRQQYIEDFAASSRQFGLDGVAGRVMGALLVWDQPELSAEELAELLGEDEDAVAQELKTFVRAGVVIGDDVPGTVRERFYLNPDAWGLLISRQLVSLMTFRRLAERGLSLLGTEEERARKNLEEMRDRYAYAERELPTLFERFEQERSVASPLAHTQPTPPTANVENTDGAETETPAADVSYVLTDAAPGSKEGMDLEEPVRREVS